LTTRQKEGDGSADTNCPEESTQREHTPGHNQARRG
jgi:hypothetical protein